MNAHLRPLDADGLFVGWRSVAEEDAFVSGGNEDWNQCGALLFHMGVWVVPSPGRRDAAPDGRVNQLSSLVGALAGALAELLPLVCGALPVAESGAVCGGAWPVVPSGVGSFLAGDDEGWVSFPVPAASLERPPPFLFSHGFLRQGDALLIGEDKPVAIDSDQCLADFVSDTLQRGKESLQQQVSGGVGFTVGRRSNAGDFNAVVFHVGSVQDALRERPNSQEAFGNKFSGVE